MWIFVASLPIKTDWLSGRHCRAPALELDLHILEKVLRMSGWMPLLLQHQMLRVTIIVDEVYLGFEFRWLVG